MQNQNTCHAYHTKGAFQVGIITKKKYKGFQSTLTKLV